MLANSDDERAQPIMEAVMALARSGRQIFYFTAQWDEVAKWQQALKHTDLAHRFIDLGAIGPLQALGEEQIEALLSREGPGTGARIYRKASAAARVLEAVLHAWRIGRGRPVDAGVLKASGAVSQSFLARAADLAEQCAGDARRLVDALERGDLPLFHRSKLEELRTYLETQGYLDGHESLDSDEIRARALAAASDDLGACRITLDRVERPIQVVAG